MPNVILDSQNNMQLTKEQIKQEYKRCARNPIYFLKKYAYIQHPKRGKVKFDLYPFQQDTILEFIKHSWNIIVKSRQLGISTLCAGYALWLMTFNKDKSILVIANKQDVAKNLIRKVRQMYELLPPFLQEPLVTDNKQSLFFANDSFIKAESANPNAGVSEALSLLIIDEAAVLSQSLFQQIFTAAAPTLSTGGDFIVLSTPRGVGGLFHKLWIQALQGRNRFNPIKLPWDVHPDRDQQFRDKQTKEMGDKKSRQEYDCDFASSGDGAIPSETLQKIQREYIKQPLEKLHNNEIWIWQMPDFTKSYILSADVARGDGKDFSAFQLICVDDSEQVAEFKGTIGTTQFGQLLVRYAKMYNNAFLIIENANVGWAVIQTVINLKYNNLYYHKKDYKYVDLQLQSKIVRNAAQEKQKDIPGFTTSWTSRPVIIQNMSVLLENGNIIIHSQRLLNQLWTFIWVNRKIQAMRGYNDDLVMAFAIAVWVRYTTYIIKKQSIKYAKQKLALMNSGLNVNKDLSPEKSSGFYNARSISQKQDHIIEVNGQNINLLDFYFKQ